MSHKPPRSAMPSEKLGNEPSGLRGHSVDVMGRRIAVRDIPAVEPEVPTLVFLHEGLGCIEMWKDFPDLLAAATGCRALIYDRLGYGRSEMADRPRDPLYFENEAYQILPALLSACGVTNPVLIGHSDGGTIALLNAGHSAVRGIITEAAHVFVEPESIAGVAAAKEAWQDEAFRRRLTRYHGGGTVEMFAAWADMWSASWFRDWNMEAALASIDCPVLAIQGIEDEYGTPDQVDAIRRGVTGAVQTLLVPDCGHAPHIQARGPVLTRMTSFINSLS
jgi:pimeloyl-ACP methyl ester carboxylesterase